MGPTPVRAARVVDHRRHLRDKRDRWKFRLERFAFEGIPSLGREELSFSSPLTVICGPNGVGKTTLLRAGAVAELVGIECGVVSGVFNLELSGIEVPDWRPRHDKHYHEA